MQKEGKVHYFTVHNSSVRAITFNPKDRYLFASGSCDGSVNLYTALRKEHLMTYNIVTASLSKVVNGIRFSSDGSKILVSTTAKRLAVIDIAHSEQIQVYDNCTFNGRDRAAIAVDPSSPNYVATTSPNGRGVTIIDLRMPLPLDFISDLHNMPVRDIQFLPSNWPFCRPNQFTMVTASNDNSFKVVTVDGKILHSRNVGHSLNTVALTPEPYQSYSDDGFSSLITCGGDHITSYIPSIPNATSQSPSNTANSSTNLVQNNSQLFQMCDSIKENLNSPIWKMKYTSSGTTCYCSDDSGVVRRYYRNNNQLTFSGIVYQHKGDVQDIDISPYDEYLVSASKDKTVGLITLGSPNHGSTEYYELT